MNVGNFDVGLNAQHISSQNVISSDNKTRKAPTRMSGVSVPTSQNVVKLENPDFKNSSGTLNQNTSLQQSGNILHTKINFDSKPKATYNEQNSELEKIKNEIQLTFESMKQKYNK